MKMLYTPKEKDKYIKEATNSILKKSPNFGFVRDEEDFKRIALILNGGDSYNDHEDEEDRIVEIDDELLGCYIPMSSPGKIKLFLDELQFFFENYICEMIRRGYNITYSDYKKMAEITIRKTFYHEYFHHYSDIHRVLYSFNKNSILEEALAVAWSRMKVNDFCRTELKIYSPDPIYETYLRKIYNYGSRGYRDWKQYIMNDDFCRAVCKYMLPGGYNILEKNGVKMGILESLDFVYKTSDAVTLELA